jgi:hypothetical protein
MLRLLLTAALLAGTPACAAEMKQLTLACHDRDLLTKMILAGRRHDEKEVERLLFYAVKEQLCRTFKPGQVVRIDIREKVLSCITDESSPLPEGCYWMLSEAVKK